jgi:hypothetical protein
MDDVDVDFADLLVEEDQLGHSQAVAFEELFWSFQGCPDERPEGSERAETDYDAACECVASRGRA